VARRETCPSRKAEQHLVQPPLPLPPCSHPLFCLAKTFNLSPRRCGACNFVGMTLPGAHKPVLFFHSAPLWHAVDPHLGVCPFASQTTADVSAKFLQQLLAKMVWEPVEVFQLSNGMLVAEVHHLLPPALKCVKLVVPDSRSCNGKHFHS
jgi:hypothetical protein